MANITLDENHIYRVDGIIKPGVSEVLKAEGFINFDGVPAAVLQRAMDFGTAVHTACELYDQARLDFGTLALPLVPYVSAWRNFKDDTKAAIMDEWIERISFCEKYGYGFRPDRVVLIKGKYILIDVKSGQPEAWHAWQSAAYQLGIEETGMRIAERWTVQLKNNDRYQIHEHKNKMDRYDWLAILTMYRLRERVCKRNV